MIVDDKDNDISPSPFLSNQLGLSTDDLIDYIDSAPWFSMQAIPPDSDMTTLLAGEERLIYDLTKKISGFQAHVKSQHLQIDELRILSDRLKNEKENTEAQLQLERQKSADLLHERNIFRKKARRLEKELATQKAKQSHSQLPLFSLTQKSTQQTPSPPLKFIAVQPGREKKGRKKRRCC